MTQRGNRRQPVFFLRDASDDRMEQVLARHSSVGRPLGKTQLLERLEELTGRRLRRGRPGRRAVLK